MDCGTVRGQVAICGMAPTSLPRGDRCLGAVASREAYMSACTRDLSRVMALLKPESEEAVLA
jgi:hypothetical protein